ncbi:hypothetical protein [Vibrio sp. Isolate24]|uniref:hypothetical protein n=1 Tax=Vibrio sp. Isolate24 TaxID=2908534 RepID=UPI001EFCB227|nr:hypothetical protein [Vibrio sp. Isolate24]MCG9680876.1 hypothetical protein [Vibrio sp. Isolate24]
MNLPRNLLKVVSREAKKARQLDKSLSLCQHMELRAKAHGFRSLDHLQKDYTVRAMKANFEARRLACAARQPNDDLNCYYQFDIDKATNTIGYFSHFTDYDDDGYELRAPSLIGGEVMAKDIRKLMKKEAYVIEDMESLYQWRFVWGGIAIINAELVNNNPLFKRTLEPSRSSNPKHTRRLTN